MKSNQYFKIYKTTRHIAVFILSVIGFTSMAQPVNNLVKDVVMPPPNVASLGKYGEIPVSYFTGVPNISIPITSVQDGPLSTSVSLSYHAAGIKVAETASWVGLNWSLNAGGMISRTIQGIADDGIYGYYNIGDYYAAAATNNSNPILALSASQGLISGQYDGEPDIFNFNVGGISGKFYIDKNHNYQFIPQQDFKLEIDGGLPFQGFTITNSDGTRYIFGKVIVNGVTREARDLSRSDGEAAANATTWYLLRIETYDKKSALDFYYDHEFYSYKSPATCKILSPTGGCITPGQGTPPPTTQCSDNGEDLYHRYIRTNIEGKRLTKIVSPTNTVEFIANTDRQDLEANFNTGSSLKRALDTIKTYTLLSNGTINPDYCSKYALSYDYYIDPNRPNYPEGKRLRLNTVQKMACNGSISEPPHEFTYQTGDIPYRLSKQVDHWGYYNGATANETKLINAPSTTINGFNYGDSDRNTNETHMKKGVLTKIKYPTGGNTQFTYEANSYVGEEEGYPDYFAGGRYWIQSCATPADPNCCANGQPKVTSKNFTFTTQDLTKVKYELGLTRLNITCNGQVPSYVGVTMRIYNLNTATQVGEIGFILSSSPYQQTYTKIDFLAALNNTTLQTGIPYKFEITTTDGYAFFNLHIIPTNVVNKLAGGLRVKTIRNSTDNTPQSDDIVKTYDYSNETGAFTSGKLLIPIRYGYSNANSNVITGENYFLLGGFGGSNHIGYERVKEILSGNGTNTLTSGYSIFKYSMVIDMSSFMNRYPAAPIHHIPSLGEIKESYQYNDNNSSQALSSTINTPLSSNTVNYNIGLIAKAAPQSICQEGSTLIGFINYYSIRHTLPYRLESVQSSKDGVTSTTQYQYNTTNAHLNPIAISTINSDGKTTNQKMYYAADITAAHPNFSPQNGAQLSIKSVLETNLNMKGVPLQTEEYIGSTLVKGTRTEFAPFGKTDGIKPSSWSNAIFNVCDFYPHKFYKYKMSWNQAGTAQVFPNNGGWEEEGTINSYDAEVTTPPTKPAKGKPASITMRGWNDPEIYTWDANGLIKTRKFKDFIWTYDYFTNTPLVQKITNIDGQFTTFIYDKFRRVTKATARNGAVVTDYFYTYKDVNQANKNWIETKTTFNTAIGGTLGYNITSKTARQYFDGLGRPIQSVAVANSPTSKDVVSAVDYDNQGREWKKYEPYESLNSNGNFVAVPTGQLFTKLEYEPSPLSRIWKVTAADLNWAGKPTITEYSGNSANEAYNMQGTALMPANSLNKVKTTDADGRVMNTFTDKKGRKVFTNQSQNNVAGGAYVIYEFDDKDRLKKVQQQRNNYDEWVSSTADLDFWYVYDWDDNVTRKKVPDADYMDMLYNVRNQLVLTQDGNQRALSRYLGIEYDNYGRPLKTGFTTATALTNGNPSFSTLLTETEYSTATSGLELGKVKRTKNYFGTYLEAFMEYNDPYGRLSAAYSNNHLYSPSGAISNTNFSEKIATIYDLADNVLTKTRTHKPNATTTRTITEIMDYDNGLRLKQNKHKVDSENEQILSYLDYTLKNQVQTKRMGKAGTLEYLQKVDYQYNVMGWLTAINGSTTNIAGAAATCALPTPSTPSTTNLDINDLFSLDLRYQNPNAAYTPTGTSATAQYGGNISQMVWQTKGRQRQTYTFQYDFLSRMTEANYAELNDASVKTNDDNKYMEKLTYDVRGNIQTLQRKGFIANCATPVMIDNLTYYYNDNNQPEFNPANRLKKVVDIADLTKGFKSQASGSTYTYDNNGNLKSDLNKGISLIEYNYLNLPIKVTFSNGNIIEWLYDGGGTKLRKVSKGIANTVTLGGVPIAPGTYFSTGLLQSTGTVASNSTVILKGKTGVELLPNFEAQSNSNFEAVQDVAILGDIQDYVGGIEYKNGAFEAIYHAEGRIITVNNTLKYEFALKDHLGNTRIMFMDKNNDGVISQNSNQELSEVTQENSYYPFGLAMEGVWMNTPSVLDSKYQFNGIELNNDFGLDLSMAFYRGYDATLGRWWQIDPKPNYSESQYVGMGNNPIIYSDLIGDTVKYSNSNMEEYVKTYTQATITDKKGVAKPNKKYDPEFAKIVSELEKSELTFNFSDDASKLQAGETDELGLVKKTSDKTFDVIIPNFTEGQKGVDQEMFGGRGAVLYEETFHAYQFNREGGTVKLAAIGYEVEAKIFASDSKAVKLSMNYEGLNIRTWSGLIRDTYRKKQTIDERKLEVGKILLEGVTREYENISTGVKKKVNYPKSYNMK